MLLTCYHASSTGTSLNMVQHKLRNFHIFSTSIGPYPGWQSIFRNSFCKTTKYCFSFVVVGSFEVYRKAGVPINTTIYYNSPSVFKYYLKHEHECFIRYKTRGAAECFISDKARIASVLNSFKNDPFYTHLVTLFTKEFSI